MTIHGLIVQALGYALLLTLISSTGGLMSGDSPLTILATSCLSVLFNDSFARKERKAGPVDLLAVAAAGGVLVAGAVVTGTATDMTGVSAAMLAGYAFYLTKKLGSGESA